MAGSRGRNAGLLLAGLAIIGLSFWITLAIVSDDEPSDLRLADVPLTNNDGSPRGSRPSRIRDLPRPPAVSDFKVTWDGIEGLSALTLGPGPIDGRLGLSLVAAGDSGRHRLGLAIGGAPADRPIRATAWIKAPQGTRIGIDVRDGEENGGPRNSGSAALELSPPKVLESHGNARTSIEAGPSNWVKVTVAMPSSDGMFVIYFGFLGPGSATSLPGAGQQMIFGGMEIPSVE